MANAGTITVAVRVRPPNTWEASRLPDACHDFGMRGEGALSTPSSSVYNASCLREVVKVVDDRILMFDPEEKDFGRSFAERGFVPPGTKRYKDKRFMFDHVFDAHARQTDVYNATAKPLLDGLLDGYNATVFAYGATGCGKTHTISGSDADPGIIYLTMADLFDKIEEKKQDFNIDIYVTFLEIYNEEIRDLLVDPDSRTARGGLQIREDKTCKVMGLVELHPKSAEEIKEIVILGNSRRTQSPTHANATSSRSHAVLQVHVSQTPKTASTTEQRALATLSIIDLAGSERAAATTNMGKRMVEGANINKSLLALGNCINALCESAGATRHVPYRNSKLTRLLKFSLGGNCKTVMIVCVAPASNHFDDTHNTLLYADRATKIKTKVVTRNVVNVERHVGQYVEAINRLNLEVTELKAKLADRVSIEKAASRLNRDEADIELERSKEDMRLKASQALPAIIGGVEPESELSIASIKKRALDARLADLRVSIQDDASSEATAEHALLTKLIDRYATVLEPSSDLHAHISHSRNAANMFEAVLRAISERRSNKLGEMDMAILKVEAQYQRSELSRKKSEAMQEALKQALSHQVGLTARALGLLARFTAILKNERDSLRNIDLESTVLADTVQRVTVSLERLMESGDTACHILSEPNATCSKSEGSVQPLAGCNRVSTLSTNTIQVQSKMPPELWRFSSNGSNNTKSPGRRNHRTPRKSLRSNLVTALANNRRNIQDKVPEKKKGVQWKDQVGKGRLDDRSFGSCSSASMSSSRPTSPPLSEGDWEDEKPEESASASVTMSIGPRRLNRLDPLFLKAGSNISSLSTLSEREESVANNGVNVNRPFSDRSNRSYTPSELLSENSESAQLGKGKAREIFSSLKEPGSTNKRRRSNVGPVRSEKVRRRSGLGLLPSPGSERGREAENMPELPKNGVHRNLHIRTPSKRSRRLSSLGSVTRSVPSIRPSLLNKGSTSQTEANTSNDSCSRPPKPSWR